jgi:hypothetical protein
MPARIFDVVGMNHRVSLEACENLARQTERDRQSLKCELQREPTNPVDPRAVKVVVTDERAKHKGHIGYLRRKVASVIAPALDRGTAEVASCRLIYVNVEHGWGRIELKLKTPASKRKS